MGSHSRRWLIRAAVGVALIGCAMTWQAFAPLILAAIGLWLTSALASRVTDDRVCLRLVAASYLIKVLLAAVMFAASYEAWPLLREYQGGGGFWSFSDDSPGYSFSGGHLMNAWKGIASVPPAYYDNWTFMIYLGVLYFCFGEQPLVVTILNAWYGSIIVLAALMILHRWRASTSATRTGVALLAFWPSFIVWSTQVMKDPVTLALTMLGLCLMLFLTDSERHTRRVFLRLVGLFALLLFVLTLFRGYTAIALGIATVLASGMGFFRALKSHKPILWERFLMIATATLIVLVAANQVDLKKTVIDTAYPPRPTPSAAEADREPVVPAATEAVAQVAAPPVVPVQPQPSEASRNSSAAEVSAKVLIQTQAEDAFSRVTPQGLNNLREGFVAAGGGSVMDAQHRFENAADVLWYLPRALSIAFLAPFPNQWVEISGRTKAFRFLATFEVLMIYLLFLGVAWRVRHLCSSLSLQTMAVWCFVFLVAVPMGVTVANVGTLFRLRLQFLFPLILLLCPVIMWPLESRPSRFQ